MNRVTWSFSPLLVALAISPLACAAGIGPPALDPAEERRTLPQPYVETTTASGEVIGVDRAPPGQELAEGLTIRLRADTRDPIDVKLAPGWYLEENGISYGPREQMSVRGRSEQRGGRSVFIATEIQNGERWVPLRDEQGRPLWKRDE